MDEGSKDARAQVEGQVLRWLAEGIEAGQHRAHQYRDDLVTCLRALTQNAWMESQGCPSDAVFAPVLEERMKRDRETVEQAEAAIDVFRSLMDHLMGGCSPKEPAP